MRLLIALCLVSVSHRPVPAAPPATLAFTASLADDRTGESLHGKHTIAFELYAAGAEGSMVWTERHEVIVKEGRVDLQLGSRTTLDPEMFGDAAFLGILVDGLPMSPRLALSSVPYAMRSLVADDALSLGGFSARDLQRRVNGACGSDEFMKEVHADGTVRCAAQARVKGACSPGEVVNGVNADGSIACATDRGITTLSVGAGLTGATMEGVAAIQVLPGNGIKVGSDGVSLDTAFADDRYVRKQGDSVAGTMHFDGDAIVKGTIRMTADQSPDVGPEIHWYGNRGAWVTGIDVANNGGSRDFVLAGKATMSPYSVEDFVYISHNGDKAPSLGVGVTPPNHPYRLQVSAADAQPEMGSLFIRKTPHQSGDLFAVVDSAGTKRSWLDAGYWLKGASPATGASVSIKADDVYARPLMFGKADGTAMFGFEYAHDTSGSLEIRSFPTGVVNVELTKTGRTGFPNGVRVGQTSTPTSATSSCTKGDMTYDDNYVYICIATNMWRRSALDAW